jgi:mRNA interferase MazF
VRPIYLARLDKTRSVLLLTREALVPHLTKVSVAPITRTIKGLAVEVTVGTRNGLEDECAVNCDNITTINKADLGTFVGFFLNDQEAELAAAINHAFDLR